MLPPSAQTTLRQALANVVAADAFRAKLDAEATLLRLAEDLAIRFALERFQRGEVKVNAVRQMLDRMGQELGQRCSKLLRAREEKMANAGLSVESHGDLLDRQFWASVPESGKRAVLTSAWEAWRIPLRATQLQQYVEELLGRGESDAAGDVLVEICRLRAEQGRGSAQEGRHRIGTTGGAIQQSRQPEAPGRARANRPAIGGGERSRAANPVERGARVRPASQEAALRRYYRAMQQALDSLADLEETRPAWVQSLRPRTGIENRVPEFIEEALVAEAMPEGLAGVLMRLPQSAGEQLAIRLGRSGRRTERENIVQLAKACGGGCTRHLQEMLKSAPPARAAVAAGLLSRLDTAGGGRFAAGSGCSTLEASFHDAVVRQLSIAGAPERGRMLSNVIELLDPMVLPLALDEIGMCGDADTAPKLLRLAAGEILPQGSDYLRVKAIEAQGRMKAPAAAGHLRLLVESRKAFGWAHPEEIRTAAAQALRKLDPEWIQGFLPQSGLDNKVLALAPLDPVPDRDVVRHRRYKRIRLPRNVPAVITSARGKQSSAISVLSLEGGLLSGESQLAVGTEATLKIPAGLRSINMQAVVRFVRPHQAGFEMVGMGLDDRAKLRRLLVSLSGTDAPISKP